MNYVFLINFVIDLGIIIGVLALAIALYGFFFDNKDENGTGR